jgi:hypothetical protein
MMNYLGSTKDKIFIAVIVMLVGGFLYQYYVNINIRSVNLASNPTTSGVPAVDKDMVAKQTAERKDRLLSMARFFSGTIESVSGNSFKVKNENYADYSNVDFSDTNAAISPVVTTKVFTVELTPETVFSAGSDADVKAGAKLRIGTDESIYSNKSLRATYIDFISPVSTSTPK